MRYLVVGCVLWCACDGTPEPDASAPVDASPPLDAEAALNDAGPLPPCEVEAPTVCPDPMPRYDDVRPIFAARCTSCHNGTDGMWPLSSYQHVADWYGEIRAQMLACTMPPVDSGVAMPLEERKAILDWIRCGFPR